MWNKSDCPSAWLMNASFEKMKTRVRGGENAGWWREETSCIRWHEHNDAGDKRKERRGDRGCDSLTGGRLTQGRQQGVKCQISPSRPVTDLHPRTERLLLLHPLLLFLSFFCQLHKISWHGSFASERRNPSERAITAFFPIFERSFSFGQKEGGKKKKKKGQYVPLLKRVWRWTRKAFFLPFSNTFMPKFAVESARREASEWSESVASHLPFWHAEQVQACQLPLGLEMWQICLKKQRLLDLSRLENGPAGCVSTSEASAWFDFQSSWGCLFVMDTKPLKLWSICMWEAGTS